MITRLYPDLPGLRIQALARDALTLLLLAAFVCYEPLAAAALEAAGVQPPGSAGAVRPPQGVA